MAKRVIKKKQASASKPRVVRRVTPNAEIDPEENDRARNAGGFKGGKPAMHAKVVQLVLSVGTDDRERSYEEFVEWIKNKIQPVKAGRVDEDGNVVRNEGVHMAVTGGYYILDGKVCMPDDYDTKKGAAKPGAFPPSWAGGPSTQQMTIKTQIQKDLEELTPDEYDKKYGLGKYGPKPVSSKVTYEGRRKAGRLTKEVKEELEDAEIEDFDWEEEDLTEESMGAVADESASRAVARLKGSKKRVVKKPAPKKKVVRRPK